MWKKTILLAKVSENYNIDMAMLEKLNAREAEKKIKQVDKQRAEY